MHCHGGDATKSDVTSAHPKPSFPREWPDSANPERPYMLTMAESEAWIRFVNPGDLRVANKTCGPCHPDETLQVMKSLMTTSQHFWGTVTYANGIVSTKRSILGESYGPDGTPQVVNHIVREEGRPDRAPTAEELAEHSWSAVAAPLPHWEVTQPSNIFRIFEKGSRLGRGRAWPQWPTGADSRLARQVRGPGPTEQPFIRPRPRHAQSRRFADAERAQDAV